MKPYKRIFTIVIDSLGVGAMPNAAEYDDEGCDTLGHIDASMPKFHIPNLASWDWQTFICLSMWHRQPSPWVIIRSCWKPVSARIR